MFSLLSGLLLLTSWVIAASDSGCLSLGPALCPAWVGVCSLPGLEPGLLLEHVGTGRAFRQQRASFCNGEERGAAYTAR